MYYQKLSKGAQIAGLFLMLFQITPRLSTAQNQPDSCLSQGYLSVSDEIRLDAALIEEVVNLFSPECPDVISIIYSQDEHHSYIHIISNVFYTDSKSYAIFSDYSKEYRAMIRSVSEEELAGLLSYPNFGQSAALSGGPYIDSTEFDHYRVIDFVALQVCIIARGNSIYDEFFRSSGFMTDYWYEDRKQIIPKE